MFRTASEEETVALGRRLAGELPPGAVLLIGNLGAGKTTLAKGIISARAGVAEEEVSSPTFTLIHDYGRVFHIDLYRLDSAGQAASLGLDDLFDEADLVLIEWGERFPELIPPQRTEIRLAPGRDNEREITVSRIE